MLVFLLSAETKGKKLQIPEINMHKVVDIGWVVLGA